MVQTVLIYSMGEVIGDGLIKLPFIAGLRAAFPDARISWCAAKGETVYAGAAEGRGGRLCRRGDPERAATARAALDSLPWSKPFGGRKFDLVIDTQENLRRSGVAKRGAAGRFVSAAHHARDKDWPVAVTDRLAQTAGPGHGRAGRAQALGVDQSRRPEGRRGPAADRPDLCRPGARRGRPGQALAAGELFELARRIVARGWTPVFFFGPDEAEDAAIAAREIPHAMQPERNRTDGFTT
jgi:ADP-heptose:LPS heptosyltransferase